MQAFRWSGLALRAAFGLCVAVCLSSCGSGAVSGGATSSGAIVVSPSTATLYSELPTTFTVTGGNGNYIVTSSDQNVLPVAATTTEHSFYVIPNDVGSDTPVTLTVRDTANSAIATASLTVKPRTIANTVTITPSAGQAAACGNALCSGGDAEVKVVLSQLGVPLAGRTVQFDVLSGDLKIISSSFAGSEVLTTSATVSTDSTGTARIRVRASADAAAQTALLKVTDLSSGFSQTASVSISQGASATLTVQPASIKFTGSGTNTCATGVSADVIVAGGHPPYQITKPPGFDINPTVLMTSGGHITITARGQCAPSGAGAFDGGQTMSIVDAAGASASVIIHNDPAQVTTTGTFDVSPLKVTLDSCTAGANVLLMGGTGYYYAASGSVVVKASASQTGGSGGAAIGVITRQPIPDSGTSPVLVAFSDGQTSKTVEVTLTNKALTGPCP